MKYQKSKKNQKYFWTIEWEMRKNPRKIYNLNLDFSGLLN